MELSAIAIKVKRFYDLGLYTASQVNDFVFKGKITNKEAKYIVEGE